MDNARLREIWKIWQNCYEHTNNAVEKEVASDILELIRDLVAEKVVNVCTREPTINPDHVLRTILGDIGIKKKQWEGGKKNDGNDE